MSAKPILFSGPMVRALIEGRKTMTRRVIKPSKPFDIGDDIELQIAGGSIPVLYAPGALLWVRETWATVNSFSGPGWAYRADGEFIQPDYDGEDFGAGPSFDYSKYPGKYTMWYSDLLAGAPEHGWCPSLHMPRWASRLTLEVTNVKVERLQEISGEDAVAEGMASHGPNRPQDDFRDLWDSLNAKRGYGWAENPWVAAVEFKVHKSNIDEFLSRREAA